MVVGLLLLALAVWWMAPAQAQTLKPLVEVGQTYGVIWGFYSESVIVDEVRGDGWVRVRNPGEKRVWWINLHQAVAITALPPEGSLQAH